MGKAPYFVPELSLYFISWEKSSYVLQICNQCSEMFHHLFCHEQGSFMDVGFVRRIQLIGATL
jgi:hypothetical protein